MAVCTGIGSRRRTTVRIGATTTAQDGRVQPDMPALLTALRDHEVEFVPVGLVAVEAWGADVGTPGDLDTVLALDRDNLGRLAAAMASVGARSWPVIGRWEPDGDDRRWVELADDDLAPRAEVRTVHGIDSVRVMSIADLLARLTVPRRKKDALRVAVLRQRQRELSTA